MVVILKLKKMNGKWMKRNSTTDHGDKKTQHGSKINERIRMVDDKGASCINCLGEIGGPRGDDSVEHQKTTSGYWDHFEKDFVITEPCVMKQNSCTKNGTVKQLYWTVIFDKPHHGRRTISYNWAIYGPEKARRLAMRHQPRRVCSNC